MSQILTNTAGQLNEFWIGLERSKRIRLVALVCILVLLTTSLVMVINRKEYVTLYKNLNPSDAGEILEKLKEMKVDAKPVGSDTILVVKSQEPEARMQLSSQGYPKSGLNYDLFMNSVGFGTTDFEKRKYLQFQLQDRLQEAIKTLNGVKNAIVTISMPDEDSFVFRDDRKPATASVVLKLEDGHQVTMSQVKGIEELVSKSILGLSTEDISIIDSNMKLLNPKGGQGSDIINSNFELENYVRERLQKQIISLLEPVFGYNKVLTAVNVRLDFDKKITETIRFEPIIDDNGMVVSMTELKEKVVNSAGGGVPGQDSNGEIPGYPGVGDDNQTYEKVSRTVNYELDQIREQIEKAQGQVKELSVSVIVDSEEMAADVRGRVQDMVASAVGVDSSHIVVDNMAFETGNALKDQIEDAMKAGGMRNSAALIRDITIYGIIGLIVLVVATLIYKLLMEGLKSSRIAMATSIIDSVAVDGPDLNELSENQNTVKQHIEHLVRQRPNEVAQLLRTWLNED